MRATRWIGSGLIAAVLASGLVTSTPSWAAPPADVQPPPATAEVTVPLSTPVDTAQANELAAQESGVVGFRYKNANVSGEFFPSTGKSLDDFDAQFDRDFGTRPQIVGLIASRDINPATGSPVQEIQQIDVKGEPFLPEDPDADSLESFKADAAPERPPGEIGRQTSGDWRPEFVETSIDEVGDTVIFTSAVDWGQSTPTAVPENFGMEVDFNAYNDANANGIDPLCLINEEYQFFAAKNHWVDWQIITFGEESGPLDTYRDITLGDVCTRGSFAVGIRYPQNIPVDSSGNYGVTVRIQAEEGDVDENRISSQLTLLDDKNCDFREQDGEEPWLGYCMGLWEYTPDDGTPVARPVLSAERRWFAPDRCWFSSDMGSAEPIPSQECGQEPVSHSAISLTGVRLDDEDPEARAWTFERDTAGLEYPLGGTLPNASFPYLTDQYRDSNEEELPVHDVRIWIDGVEQVVQWQGWRLLIPDDGDSIALQNWNGNSTAQIGDGSLSTVKRLAQSGKISFRVEDGPANFISFGGLGNQVDASSEEDALLPEKFRGSYLKLESNGTSRAYDQAFVHTDANADLTTCFPEGSNFDRAITAASAFVGGAEVELKGIGYFQVYEATVGVLYVDSRLHNEYANVPVNFTVEGCEGPIRARIIPPFWQNTSPQGARMTFGNGTFIGIPGTSGLPVTSGVMMSSDGKAWEAVASNLPSLNWVNVTFGNGVFVATAQSGVSRIWTSPDGRSWSPATVPPETKVRGAISSWSGLTFGDGKFFANNRSYNAIAPQVISSTDGLSWQIVATYGRNASPPVGKFIGNMWVSITNVNFVTYTIKTSSDGINWTDRLTTQETLRTATYGNGTFVAVAEAGWSGTGTIFTSPDGANWTTRQTGILDAKWSLSDFHNGHFVVSALTHGGGYGLTRAMTSTDGINWKVIPYSPKNCGSLLSGQGVFVQTCTGGIYTGRFAPGD